MARDGSARQRIDAEPGAQRHLVPYRAVLHIEIGPIDNVPRARMPVRVPVVLSRDEVARIMKHLNGVTWIVVALLYGAGLRLQECLELRVKDVDWERRQIVIRRGKGQKDRPTVLPTVVIEPLSRHLDSVKRQHQTDLARGFGRVVLPFALDRKYSNAATEWAWQFVFPACRVCTDPRWAYRRAFTSTNQLSRRRWRTQHGGRASPSVWVHIRSAFVCDPPARGWVRHSDRAGATGSCRHQHDDGVHARAQSRRARRAQSHRSPLTARVTTRLAASACVQFHRSRPTTYGRCGEIRVTSARRGTCPGSTGLEATADSREGCQGSTPRVVRRTGNQLIEIRDEQPGDIEAVREVNRQAFDQEQEGRIIDALREHDGVLVSLVAVIDGAVVGHIMFSPLTVGLMVGAALGPMAVLPEYQRRGIGSRLVRQGIERLRSDGCPFIVVIGHPEFYPRFGFQPAGPKGLSCEWEVPGGAFMVTVLNAEVGGDLRGLTKYRPEFSTVE
jgi:predicted N-acetyltransferase YhbS/integrase